MLIKKYRDFILVVIGIMLLQYLEKIIFNIEFSLINSLSMGIVGGLGYLFGTKSK